MRAREPGQPRPATAPDASCCHRCRSLPRRPPTPPAPLARRQASPSRRSTTLSNVARPRRGTRHRPPWLCMPGAFALAAARHAACLTGGLGCARQHPPRCASAGPRPGPTGQSRNQRRALCAARRAMLNLCSYVLVLVEDVQTDLSAGTVERSWAYRRVYRGSDTGSDSGDLVRSCSCGEPIVFFVVRLSSGTPRHGAAGGRTGGAAAPWHAAWSPLGQREARDTVKQSTKCRGVQGEGGASFPARWQGGFDGVRLGAESNAEQRPCG